MTYDEEPGWTKISRRQLADDIRQYGPSIEVEISAAAPGSVGVPALALIDTGAHSTGIGPQIAKRLALQPIDTGVIREAGREPIIAAVYRIRLFLPSTDIELDVAGLPSLSAPHDVVIGRDILSNCRFAIDFAVGRTWLHIKTRS